MRFSYNWLQSYFIKKLPTPEKLAELLTLHFAEVESVEKQGKDSVLDVDVRPNRAADCLSHDGLAREISAILNYKLKNLNHKPVEDKKLKVKNFVNVQLQGRGHCSRYTARAVTGVKVAESPKWLCEKLIACGLRPINNVVDATNYVMLQTGRPLHAFDADKIEDKQIIIRFAKAGEKITTIEGNRVDLNDNVLVIADDKKPIAIAGIKGGKNTEVDRNTKTVIIEAANFNAQLIRSASRKINLRTDASLRFEHGIDPNLAAAAQNKTAFLIKKIAGGKIAKGMIDIYPKQIFPKLIRLDLAYVESLLGVKISALEIKKILQNLSFEVKKSNSNFIDVKVPTSRVDVEIQEDLIEEVGRIYGYEKIPAQFPKVSLIPPKRNLNIFWEEMIKNILKEADFTEVSNYCFISERDKNIFDSKNLIELENPLSADYKYLRPTLTAGLLKNIERNHKNFEKIKIFELGKVFSSPNSEKIMISGMILGDKFYEAKGVIDLLLHKLGISNICYDEYRTQQEETKISWWHPKKSAEIKIDGEGIGFLGEITPKILSAFRINSKVVYFDIFFERLLEIASEEHEYRPISKFPAAVRDIAVLVPRNVKVEQVLNKIEEVQGGEIIRDIDLFDIYDGNEIEGQKKNLAFHIIFQSALKTLSSEEIDGVFSRIIKSLEKNPEWQVRK